MLTTKTTTNRRRAALAIATGAVAVAGLAATGAGSANAAYSNVESCTGVAGLVTHSPGMLTTTARNQQSVFTGTLTGCSGINGAQSGSGTITIIASGSSSNSLMNETGTVTVNWPASSGLNPSNGKVTLSRASSTAPLSVYGSFTSGAFTGAVVSTDLLVTSHNGYGTTAHPITRQRVVNTTPFAAKVNFG
jgi:hypothetical protein